MSPFGDRMHGSYYTIRITLNPLQILGFAVFLFGSNLSVRGRFGLQSAPVDSRRQPAPFGQAQGAGDVIALRPGKATLMQTPYAQPDTGAVPDQHLDARAIAIPKRIGGAITRRSPQSLLDLERQAIDAHAHIHRFDGQPDLVRTDHRRTSRNHCPQTAASDSGQVIWKTVS